MFKSQSTGDVGIMTRDLSTHPANTYLSTYPVTVLVTGGTLKFQIKIFIFRTYIVKVETILKINVCNVKCYKEKILRG